MHIPVADDWAANYILGTIQKVCHRPRGRGVKQNSDKEWQGGRGVKQNSDVSAYINFQEKLSWENTFALL